MPNGLGWGWREFEDGLCDVPANANGSIGREAFKDYVKSGGTLAVEASEPVRLLSTSPEFELPVHEANTVLQVLEIRAVQIGLPKAAAALLKLEFAGAIISHETTLKEAGLFDGAEISVQGEDEVRQTPMRVRLGPVA